MGKVLVLKKVANINEATFSPDLSEYRIPLPPSFLSITVLPKGDVIVSMIADEDVGAGVGNA